MKPENEAEELRGLASLSSAAKDLISKQDYRDCREQIATAMSLYPNAPQPHNLMGVLLEAMGDHVGAMKHFRASWALDPTYLPTRYNLERYASLYPQGACSYDENDCPWQRSGEPEGIRRGGLPRSDGRKGRDTMT